MGGWIGFSDIAKNLEIIIDTSRLIADRIGFEKTMPGASGLPVRKEEQHGSLPIFAATPRWGGGRDVCWLGPRGRP